MNTDQKHYVGMWDALSQSFLTPEQQAAIVAGKDTVPARSIVASCPRREAVMRELDEYDTVERVMPYRSTDTRPCPNCNRPMSASRQYCSMVCYEEAEAEYQQAKHEDTMEALRFVE